MTKDPKPVQALSEEEVFEMFMQEYERNYEDEVYEEQPDSESGAVIKNDDPLPF